MKSSHLELHAVNPFNLKLLEKIVPSIEKYIKLLLTVFRTLFLALSLILIFSKLFIFGKKCPKIMIIQVFSHCQYSFYTFHISDTTSSTFAAHISNFLFVFRNKIDCRLA